MCGAKTLKSLPHAIIRAVTNQDSNDSRTAVTPTNESDDHEDRSAPKAKVVMSRLVRIEDAGRSFDIEFWQRQGDAAIFRAAWDMVVQSYKLKGKDVRELSFQRSVVNFQRRSG